MATSYHNVIEQLYVAYFNRPADAAGLAYWQAALEAQQGNTAGMSAAFASSAEYQFSYAGLNAGATVARVYQNLFGRPAEAAGVSYWASLLESGKLSIDTIVKNIADGAQGIDKNAFANKVAAATAFTAALDTPIETAAYAATSSAPAARAFIESIRFDASLAAALQPAALAATIEHIVQSHSISLTSAKDTINDSVGHNTYLAPIVNGAATLSAGDAITSAPRTLDTLKAELPNQVAFAVAPYLSGIEQVEVRAVATGPAAGAAHYDAVRLDATQITGTRHYVSAQSTADLLIENIRLPANGNTRDISIEMRSTASGDVDFAAYFDHDALRDTGVPGSALRLQLIDNISTKAGDPPLLNNPYDRFYFSLNGKQVMVQSQAIDDALTYDQLLAAVKGAVAAVDSLKNVVVSLGPAFTATSPAGTVFTGQEIVLTSSANDSFGTENAGFGTSGVVPNGAMHQSISALPLVSAPHVSATIILDDAGSASTGGRGGDLLVGSMGNTLTTASDVPGGAIAAALTLAAPYTEGVERFDIEVRNTSSLQTISSTSGALRDVFIRNGYASASSSIDHGGLSVTGGAVTLVADEAQPRATVHGLGMGFSDVRTIDASAMKGRIEFTAELTNAAIAKYAPAPDALTMVALSTTAVVYSGGAESDKMGIVISGDVLASITDVLAGRPDFSFTANGGAGDDIIELTIKPGQANWYAKQAAAANASINGGAGNDKVVLTGQGNVIVDLGAGDDSYYALNAGVGDSTITGGLGNDLFTLNTLAGNSPAASSNDKLVYAKGPFGADTVVNFGAGSANGADQFDFSALGGRGAAFAGAALSNTDKSITIQAQTSTNDSAAEIAALYVDGTAASTHVFIAVDVANVGQVYTVSDSADGGVVATLVGSIQLIGTPWASLTAGNFT